MNEVIEKEVKEVIKNVVESWDADEMASQTNSSNCGEMITFRYNNQPLDQESEFNRHKYNYICKLNYNRKYFDVKKMGTFVKILNEMKVEDIDDWKYITTLFEAGLMQKSGDHFE